MPPPAGYAWEFKPRFRRNAFGWKSQPAAVRVRQAVSEIKKVARRDAMLGAEGAVLFLERVAPALEQIDGSSGAMGTAVRHAIDDLVPLIAAAPADATTRHAWLDRLLRALDDDGRPWIESLADHWGELCASPDIASVWGDRLLGGELGQAVLADGASGGLKYTTAGLGALDRAGRHAEVVDLAESSPHWWVRRWAVKSLAALGRTDDAVALAEASRGPWTSDGEVDEACEVALLRAGRVEVAYALYGLGANRGGTHLATFRALTRKYPHKAPHEILADLVRASPGDEGRWFTAAKEIGLYDAALAVARASACDPRTLTRAARDHAADRPDFALEAGCLALDGLVHGMGYEVTGADVWAAWSATMAAAEQLGQVDATKDRLRQVVEGGDAWGFAAQILARRLAERE
ncbi:MAG: hypothetical protein ACOYOB_17970 [Myxococcota bacterium]